MKRILIFSTAYHPFIGGAEIAVKEITDKVEDIEFDMITLNLDGKQLPIEKMGNITVHRIGKAGKVSKLLFPFMAKRKASELNSMHPYDATWSIMASFSGFAALFFKKQFPQVRFLLTLQEGDPISYIKRKVWFVYPWFKQIFQKADKIQTISHYLADFAKSMGATAPIVVIPNGVDVSLFQQASTSVHREVMKIAASKKDDDIILVTTSRLVKKNGVADVINAMPLLPHNVKFNIIGRGFLEENLKLKVKRLGLADRVHFIGQVEYQNIPHYLAASDIFIRPSLSEGMGNSFIEAMAAGIPVIATPVGGISDFLKDKETGVFCKVHDPDSIAKAVTVLMENRELREKIVRQACELATKNYDWNLIAERMKTEFFATV